LILSVAHGGLGAQPSSSKGEREEEEKKKKKKTVARSQVNSSSNSGIDQQRQEKNKRNTSSSTEEDKKARILESSEAYPMIRVFKNDLCRLEITGDAIPWQAIAAMAADGGLTAAEELAKGKSLMTIETLIPGRSADHSSISTKLLAPTRVVAQRSRTIWAREQQQFSSGSAFGSAFQSVVMQQLLQFQLCFYIPGTSRDMEDLAHEQEAEIMAKIEGLDGDALENLARAVCTYALKYRKENEQQQQEVLEESIWSRLTTQLYKQNQPVSAVHICPLSTAEMLGYKERFSKETSSLGDRHRDGVHLDQPSRTWWPKAAPAGFVLQKGWEAQVNEYLPVHKLEVDVDKLHVQVFGGQKTNAHSIWEIHLSHAQMVDLADVLDMYYEDDVTCPGKVLLTDVDLKVPHHSWSKVTQAIWVAGLSGVVGGVLLICLLVAARLRGISITHARDLQSSPVSLTALTHSSFLHKWKGNRSKREPLMPKNKDVSDKELEILCGLVVGILKDSFKWPYDIESRPGQGAWIGTDLTQWGRAFSQGQVADKQEVDSLVRDTEAGTDRNRSDDEIQLVSKDDASADSVTSDSFEAGGLASPQIQPSPSDQNVFIFQVVVSRKGKVLGFQPGNKAAIPKWASYPFAKMLHGGRNLRAGLLERGVKYTRPPDDCIVLELLVQDNSDTPCVTVRPLQL